MKFFDTLVCCSLLRVHVDDGWHSYSLWCYNIKLYTEKIWLKIKRLDGVFFREGTACTPNDV